MSPRFFLALACVSAPFWILGVFACENQGPIISCESSDLVFLAENLTHIVSSTKSEKCRFIIPREPGVCQVKLELLAFHVGDADSLGECPPDNVMTLSGSPTIKTELRLCGNLTGQHLYLDFGDNDKIQVDINGVLNQASYDVLVTQFKCNHPDKGPPHCLQYYKGTRGTVKSFNYPQQQLNNQQYTVCVEAIPGSKSIQWTPCAEAIVGGKKSAFFITGNNAKSPAAASSSGSGITGNACSTDYVQIFGENRRCGSSFSPIKSSAKPYMMFVDFDSSELPMSPIPPVMSLAISNRMDVGVGGSIFSSGGACPDLSAVGLVCNLPAVPCDGNEFSGAAGGNSRRGGGKDATICTCTAPALNSDHMNVGFCLDFLQV